MEAHEGRLEYVETIKLSVPDGLRVLFPLLAILDMLYSCLVGIRITHKFEKFYGTFYLFKYSENFIACRPNSIVVEEIDSDKAREMQHHLGG
jgi:hypothetical protein